MNNKSSIVALVVIAIIAISVPLLRKPVVNVTTPPVTVNVPEQKAPVVNVAAAKIPAPVVNNVQSTPIPTLGSVVNLDSVDNPFVTINGLKTWRSTVPMTATSSIVCSIPNGLSATSTIVSASAEVTNRGGIVQANNFTISTSTTFYATSTPALVFGYAMGTGQFSVELAKNTATTTGTAFGVPSGVLPGATQAGASQYIVGPSDKVQFAISTSTANGGTFGSYMTGRCSVELKKI